MELEKKKNIIFFVAAAVVLIFGIVSSLVLTDKLYAWLIVLFIAGVLLVFFRSFEKKSQASRSFVLVAVLTSLSVVGRFIPVIKPVTAIVILSGLYLSAPTGFLVGVLSAVVSNFYFGQGPWSLFQMLAWGLCGLFAGLLSTVLQKNRGLLLIYGVLTGVAYSLIMDVWTVLWAYNGFNISAYLTAIVTALPFTASYIVSNVVFLLVLNKPLGHKLLRIKKKYL